MDFQDALHLASRVESAEFVTFDAKLVKRARVLGVAVLRVGRKIRADP
jgi:hypothetical protein